MTKWEYHVFELNKGGIFSKRHEMGPDLITQELNTRGAEGWELVNVVPVSGEGTTFSFTVVMKRPV
jgi:hypothetical protein